MIRLTAAALTAVCLPACETLDKDVRPRGVAMYEGDPRLGNPAEKMCITEEVDGIMKTEEQSVVIREGSKHFLVEVPRSCAEMEYARWVAMDVENGTRFRGTQKCVSAGDNIYVSEASSGPAAFLGPQRCVITALHEWHPKGRPPEPQAPADAVAVAAD
jgi:Family of unknown function (DUF6491)